MTKHFLTFNISLTFVNTSRLLGSPMENLFCGTGVDISSIEVKPKYKK